MTLAVQRAIWDGDTEALDQAAPCRCCCEEHTFENCPAREWFGCRGTYTDQIESTEAASWERVYSARGMTREEFYDLPSL